MPELPEVETIRRNLKDKLINKKIIDVKVLYPNMIMTDLNDFINNIKNQTIIDIKRRGKWLMFELDNYYLLSHLRMEGRYIFRDNDELNKHEHVIFYLNDNTNLRYKDTRKFGRMYLLDKEDIYNKKPLCDLGLEPSDLTLNYLKSKFKNKKIPIKTVLLDQSILVGIGNIYDDEILFKSGINPNRLASSLNDSDINNIIKYTNQILEDAIKNNGTTIRSYEATEGTKGSNQNNLLVHTKDICPKCNSKLIKEKISGRSTYYCNKCQI